MGTPWHLPKYKREDRTAKSNPQGRRGGKKDNKTASKKILWDRFLAQRQRAWEWIVRAERSRLEHGDDYFYGRNPDERIGSLLVMRFGHDWYAPSIEDHLRRAEKIEKELSSRAP